MANGTTDEKERNSPFNCKDVLYKKKESTFHRLLRRRLENPTELEERLKSQTLRREKLIRMRTPRARELS